jgi:WhiB family redox-sensing transcriptional regulator
MPPVGHHAPYVFDDWRDDAACRGRTDVRWHPPIRIPGDGTGYVLDWSYEAREICASCPVRWECLDHAIANHEHGIWGGLTDIERDFFRRARAGSLPSAVPDCPVCGGDGVRTQSTKDRAMCLADYRHRYGKKEDGKWRA